MNYNNNNNNPTRPPQNNNPIYQRSVTNINSNPQFNHTLPAFHRPQGQQYQHNQHQFYRVNQQPQQPHQPRPQQQRQPGPQVERIAQTGTLTTRKATGKLGEVQKAHATYYQAFASAFVEPVQQPATITRSTTSTNRIDNNHVVTFIHNDVRDNNYNHGNNSDNNITNHNLTTNPTFKRATISGPRNNQTTKAMAERNVQFTQFPNDINNTNYNQDEKTAKKHHNMTVIDIDEDPVELSSDFYTSNNNDNHNKSHNFAINIENNCNNNDNNNYTNKNYLFNNNDSHTFTHFNAITPLKNFMPIVNPFEELTPQSTNLDLTQAPHDNFSNTNNFNNTSNFNKNAKTGLTNHQNNDNDILLSSQSSTSSVQLASSFRPHLGTTIGRRDIARLKGVSAQLSHQLSQQPSSPMKKRYTHHVKFSSPGHKRRRKARLERENASKWHNVDNNDGYGIDNADETLHLEPNTSNNVSALNNEQGENLFDRQDPVNLMSDCEMTNDITMVSTKGTKKHPHNSINHHDDDHDIEPFDPFGTDTQSNSRYHQTNHQYTQLDSHNAAITPTNNYTDKLGVMSKSPKNNKNDKNEGKNQGKNEGKNQSKNGKYGKDGKNDKNDKKSTKNRLENEYQDDFDAKNSQSLTKMIIDLNAELQVARLHAMNSEMQVKVLLNRVRTDEVAKNELKDKYKRRKQIFDIERTENIRLRDRIYQLSMGNYVTHQYNKSNNNNNIIKNNQFDQRNQTQADNQLEIIPPRPLETMSSYQSSHLLDQISSLISSIRNTNISPQQNAELIASRKVLTALCNTIADHYSNNIKRLDLIAQSYDAYQTSVRPTLSTITTINHSVNGLALTIPVTGCPTHHLRHQFQQYVQELLNHLIPFISLKAPNANNNCGINSTQVDYTPTLLAAGRGWDDYEWDDETAQYYCDFVLAIDHSFSFLHRLIKPSTIKTNFTTITSILDRYSLDIQTACLYSGLFTSLTADEQIIFLKMIDFGAIFSTQALSPPSTNLEELSSQLVDIQEVSSSELANLQDTLVSQGDYVSKVNHLQDTLVPKGDGTTIQSSPTTPTITDSPTKATPMQVSITTPPTSPTSPTKTTPITKTTQSSQLIIGSEDFDLSTRPTNSSISPQDHNKDSNDHILHMLKSDSDYYAMYTTYDDVIFAFLQSKLTSLPLFGNFRPDLSDWLHIPKGLEPYTMLEEGCALDEMGCQEIVDVDHNSEIDNPNLHSNINTNYQTHNLHSHKDHNSNVHNFSPIFCLCHHFNQQHQHSLENVNRNEQGSFECSTSMNDGEDGNYNDHNDDNDDNDDGNSNDDNNDNGGKPRPNNNNEPSTALTSHHPNIIPQEYMTKFQFSTIIKPGQEWFQLCRDYNAVIEQQEDYFNHLQSHINTYNDINQPNNYRLSGPSRDDDAQSASAERLLRSQGKKDTKPGNDDIRDNCDNLDASDTFGKSDGIMNTNDYAQYQCPDEDIPDSLSQSSQPPPAMKEVTRIDRLLVHFDVREEGGGDDDDDQDLSLDAEAIAQLVDDQGLPVGYWDAQHETSHHIQKRREKMLRDAFDKNQEKRRRNHEKGSVAQNVGSNDDGKGVYDYDSHETKSNPGNGQDGKQSNGIVKDNSAPTTKTPRAPKAVERPGHFNRPVKVLPSSAVPTKMVEYKVKRARNQQDFEQILEDFRKTRDLEEGWQGRDGPLGFRSFGPGEDNDGVAMGDSDIDDGLNNVGDGQNTDDCHHSQLNDGTDSAHDDNDGDINDSSDANNVEDGHLDDLDDFFFTQAALQPTRGKKANCNNACDPKNLSLNPKDNSFNSKNNSFDPSLDQNERNRHGHPKGNPNDDNQDDDLLNGSFHTNNNVIELSNNNIAEFPNPTASSTSLEKLELPFELTHRKNHKQFTITGDLSLATMGANGDEYNDDLSHHHRMGDHGTANINDLSFGGGNSQGFTHGDTQGQLMGKDANSLHSPTSSMTDPPRARSGTTDTEPLRRFDSNSSSLSSFSVIDTLGTPLTTRNGLESDSIHSFGPSDDKDAVTNLDISRDNALNGICVNNKDINNNHINDNANKHNYTESIITQPRKKLRCGSKSSSGNFDGHDGAQHDHSYSQTTQMEDQSNVDQGTPPNQNMQDNAEGSGQSLENGQDGDKIESDRVHGENDDGKRQDYQENDGNGNDVNQLTHLTPKIEDANQLVQLTPKLARTNSASINPFDVVAMVSPPPAGLRNTALFTKTGTPITSESLLRNNKNNKNNAGATIKLNKKKLHLLGNDCGADETTPIKSRLADTLPSSGHINKQSATAALVSRTSEQLRSDEGELLLSLGFNSEDSNSSSQLSDNTTTTTNNNKNHTDNNSKIPPSSLKNQKGPKNPQSNDLTKKSALVGPTPATKRKSTHFDTDNHHGEQDQQQYQEDELSQNEMNDNQDQSDTQNNQNHSQNNRQTHQGQHHNTPPLKPRSTPSSSQLGRFNTVNTTPSSRDVNRMNTKNMTTSVGGVVGQEKNAGYRDDDTFFDTGNHSKNNISSHPIHQQNIDQLGNDYGDVNDDDDGFNLDVDMTITKKTFKTQDDIHADQKVGNVGDDTDDSLFDIPVSRNGNQRKKMQSDTDNDNDQEEKKGKINTMANRQNIIELFSDEEADNDDDDLFSVISNVKNNKGNDKSTNSRNTNTKNDMVLNHNEKKILNRKSKIPSSLSSSDTSDSDDGRNGFGCPSESFRKSLKYKEGAREMLNNTNPPIRNNKPKNKKNATKNTQNVNRNNKALTDSPNSSRQQSNQSKSSSLSSNDTAFDNAYWNVDGGFYHGASLEQLPPLLPASMEYHNDNNSRPHDNLNNKNDSSGSVNGDDDVRDRKRGGEDVFDDVGFEKSKVGMYDDDKRQNNGGYEECKNNSVRKSSGNRFSSNNTNKTPQKSPNRLLTTPLPRIRNNKIITLPPTNNNNKNNIRGNNNSGTNNKTNNNPNDSFDGDMSLIPHNDHCGDSNLDHHQANTNSHHYQANDNSDHDFTQHKNPPLHTPLPSQSKPNRLTRTSLRNSSDSNRSSNTDTSHSGLGNNTPARDNNTDYTESITDVVDHNHNGNTPAHLDRSSNTPASVDRNKNTPTRLGNTISNTNKKNVPSTSTNGTSARHSTGPSLIASRQSLTNPQSSSKLARSRANLSSNHDDHDDDEIVLSPL